MSKHDSTDTSLSRELKRGTLELVLLRLLASEPRYGYELVSELRERSDGELEIKEGTLYPVLYRLEDRGLVAPQWQQQGRGVPRKYYSLTDAGQRQLESLKGQWLKFSSAVDRLLD